MIPSRMLVIATIHGGYWSMPNRASYYKAHVATTCHLKISDCHDLVTIQYISSYIYIHCSFYKRHSNNSNG